MTASFILKLPLIIEWILSAFKIERPKPDIKYLEKNINTTSDDYFEADVS